MARTDKSVAEVFSHARAVLTSLQWRLLNPGPAAGDAPGKASWETFLHAAPPDQAGGNETSDSTRAIHLETSLDFSFEGVDLVMVDEAAAQPTAMMERFLGGIRDSARQLGVILTGTVHGYEGTGHGLLRALERAEAKGMKLTRLKWEIPTRWPLGDPVEKFIANTLLLDPEPLPLPSAILDDALEVERIRRQDLISSEETIREVYGLLALSHYRTRPADLRLLLDETRLELFAIWTGCSACRRLVACALLLHEQRGGLRRHDLLAEALAALASDLQAVGCGPAFLRIARVAVHPQVQGEGLGRKLLSGMLQVLATRGDGRADMIGAIFACNSRLLNFWSSAGFTQVKISKKTGLGASNSLVIKPVSAAGRRFFESSMLDVAENKHPVVWFCLTHCL